MSSWRMKPSPLVWAMGEQPAMLNVPWNWPVRYTLPLMSTATALAYCSSPPIDVYPHRVDTSLLYQVTTKSWRLAFATDFTPSGLAERSKLPVTTTPPSGVAASAANSLEVSANALAQRALPVAASSLARYRPSWVALSVMAPKLIAF